MDEEERPWWEPHPLEYHGPVPAETYEFAEELTNEIRRRGDPLVAKRGDWILSQDDVERIRRIADAD